jgi:hypothetical protein
VVSAAAGRGVPELAAAVVLQGFVVGLVAYFTMSKYIPYYFLFITTSHSVV